MRSFPTSNLERIKQLEYGVCNYGISSKGKLKKEVCGMEITVMNPRKKIKDDTK